MNVNMEIGKKFMTYLETENEDYALSFWNDGESITFYFTDEEKAQVARCLEYALTMLNKERED